MTARHRPYGPYERFVKRPLDFALALTALVVLSPALLALWALVRVKLGGPALFRQERPGRDGKVFRLVKFRSMTDARDADGELLPDEARLTAFGKRLRSTSLDELPTLWNIVKGDMSIVGPRPLLVKYLDRYSAHQARRHEVRPGLTGLAQVHGRNAITWEEKFDWDVSYVDRITFLGDCRIVWETVRLVLRREGVSPEASATMEEFMGTPEDGAGKGEL